MFAFQWVETEQKKRYREQLRMCTGKNKPGKEDGKVDKWRGDHNFED